jgi:hypothetical protein
MPNKMKVFCFGKEREEYYVAKSMEDAKKALMEVTGEKFEDYCPDLTVTEIDDEEKITFICDDWPPAGALPSAHQEQVDDPQRLITAKAGEWAKANGRGFLASSEY